MLVKRVFLLNLFTRRKITKKYSIRLISKIAGFMERKTTGIILGYQNGDSQFL